MTTIDDPTTAKAALLVALQSERDRWETLIAEAGPDRLTTPGVCGDQSIKDLLGHLTAYIRRWGAELHGIATGTQPTIRDLFDVDALPDDAPTWDMDGQNAAIRALYSPLPTETVLAKWRAAHDLLRDSISSLTESQIATPGAIPAVGNQPLAVGIAGDTFAHHTHHAAEVRAWLDNVQ